MVPAPRLRVDRLAHGAQQPQRGEVVPVGPRLAEAHQPADRGRRAVEHVDAVLLDHAPPAVRVGESRRAFVHEARRPDQQRRIDDVRVAGDPARVGGAPVAVVLFQVEHRLECGPYAHHVAAVGVQDRLGLAGRAGGVEHEQRVLGVHHLGVAAVPAAGRARHRQPHQLVPPVVPPLLHRHLMAGALEDDHVLHGRRALKRLVHDPLQLDDLAVHVAAVAGDADVGFAVLQPAVQRLHRKAAVHHRVHRADLGARQHGDGQLGHAAHVDRHPVALLHAHAAQDVGELAHLAAERVVGEGAHLAVLALPDQRQLVAPPGGHVPVEAVGDDVRLAADEPLEERRVRVIQHRVPLLEPLELFGLRGPESRQISLGPPGHFLVALDVGVGDDFRRWLVDVSLLHGIHGILPG